MKTKIPPYLFFISILIVLLSANDAFLTLHHIQVGGEEIMPTMKLALQYGAIFFVISKIVITSIAVMFMAAHHNVKMVSIWLSIILIIYILLTGYHITLLYT